MPNLEFAPWFAVAPRSVVLGRDGVGRWVERVTAGHVTLTDGRTFPIDPMSTVTVLVPDFDDALGILARAFPGLEIIE